jgi:Domain of unknown function DUF11
MISRNYFRRALLTLLACSAVAIMVFGSGSAQAAPAVAWEIDQTTNPTNLIPGTTAEGGSGAVEVAPGYALTVTNVGGITAENVTVTDTLPFGVVPTITSEFRIPEPRKGNQPEPCESAVGQTITCHLSEPIAPGVEVSVWIPIEVEAETNFEPLPTTITNTVAVTSSNAPAASQKAPTTVSNQHPPFALLGSHGLGGTPLDEAGQTPAAGEHPFTVRFHLAVPTVTKGAGGFREVFPVDPLRSVGFELPEGLVANPTAAERCLQAEFNGEARRPPVKCKATSQIGRVEISSAKVSPFISPLYDLKPAPGVPAEFGFILAGSAVHVVGGIDSSFHLTAESRELLTKFKIPSVRVELWGHPTDPRFRRFLIGQGCGEKTDPEPLCSVEPSPVPFLTMPTECTGQIALGAWLTGWLGGETERTVPFTTLEGKPVGVAGCDKLDFEPTIESRATTNAAETSSGFDFTLHQRQEEVFEGRSTAALKDATVTLPDGMTLNPAAANGLSSCSEQQMGYAPEAGKIRFTTELPSCPRAAKVGTLEVRTPLLDSPLPGSIYVATPYDNPFGSLLAIYLAVEDEEAGIFTKLAGKVSTDPATGRLTATFTDNPQLPIEDFDLHFVSGARGILTTPLTCGDKVTTSTLTPWSSPEGADAHPIDSFQTAAGCQASEAAAPKAVSFEAGTESPLAGAFSPFVLRLARNDGTQHITGIDTTLPEGLTGKLAGVPYCSESGIAQAVSREKPEMGKVEQADPSCPVASEVGSVQVTAGSGTAPIPVTGHAYLAGPYKGAPISLVVIVPAVAGPFDLGTVVDRVALNVDPYTARIHAVADPLPTIREGIPLDVRSIEVKLDRPNFALNPTSCEVKAIEGSVSTQAGQTAALNNRFQVGECRRLGFKPKIGLSLQGQTKRTGHPALTATVTYPKGGAYANIARAQVSLPHSEFLDQGNIGKACTKPVLDAGACPARSIYGKVKAWTPLLEKPLEGPVYLVGGYGYKLPAMVAELNGQIRVLLVGKVDTGKNKGIRNTFEAVPDAPVEKFVLQLKGGKKYGLLVNSENICKSTQKAEVAFKAQNGKQLTLTPKIANSCKGGKHKKPEKK